MKKLPHSTGDCVDRLERVEQIDHVARRVGLDDILFLEVGVVAPNVGIGSEGTRHVQHVVGISVANRLFSLLEIRIELAGGNDFDVLEEEVYELCDSIWSPDFSTISSS